jgi:adenylylsulfate kinase
MTKQRGAHIVWHNASVTRRRCETQSRHRGAGLWFTGLSGSGKSTLAHAAEETLHTMRCRTSVLDGENVRHGLCSDPGFTEEDLNENIRRIGETVKLFVEAGIMVLTAFVSPFRSDLGRVRSIMSDGDFLEFYYNCSLEICERRDVKGLYKRARVCGIPDFTDISSPYEPPLDPELELVTDVKPQR